MKYLIPFTMSLLSLLFGCSPKKSPAKAEAYPRFPETDNPAAQVMPVKLDDGYWPKSFFISADKQSLFVLGYGKIVSTTMQEGEETRPDLRDRGYFRLFALNTRGQIVYRLDLPPGDVYTGSTFGIINGQTVLWFGDQFLVLDTQKLAVREKIPVYDIHYFPTKRNIELMTPDEQQDAYLQKFEAAVAKPATCKWLEWPFGGGYLVLVEGPAGKQSAWAPLSWENEVLADLKSRFEPLSMPYNPNANNYENGDSFKCSDGPVQIREAEYLSAGTELDYPNYKSRMVLQYEMTVGSKILHFSTTDKGRHNLRLDFTDDRMLATTDGAAWLKYEGELYRIE
ncbi:MAG: hypothetical protein ABIQ93_09255 [Saprospiraceae bacterium]